MKRMLFTGIVLLIGFSSFRNPQISNNDGSLRLGDAAPEIVAKDLNGQQFKLSSYRGYYVFVDFWASWCEPCRKANPHISELFQKLSGKKFKKAKGIVVVSVSVDSNPTKWAKAVAKDGVTNFINISDGLGWDSPILDAFGINYLPANFLISPNGEVEAFDLFGPNLEAVVSSLR